MNIKLSRHQEGIVEEVLKEIISGGFKNSNSI
jgi:hypothetical protein